MQDLNRTARWFSSKRDNNHNKNNEHQLDVPHFDYQSIECAYIIAVMYFLYALTSSVCILSVFADFMKSLDD